MAFPLRGRIESTSVREEGAEEDICAKNRENNRLLKKILERGTARFVLFITYYWGDEIDEDILGRACGAVGNKRHSYRVK